MGKATDKCRNAVFVLGFTHPHFLLIHQKIQYVEQTGGGGVGTMGITAAGRILIDPTFVDKLEREELAGVLAHEMLHLVLLHHGRRGSRDTWMWNIATDMCINQALKMDGISIPKTGVFPPNEYKGELYAEALYEWLEKNRQYVPPKPIEGQSVQPGAGCSVIDEPNAESTDWRQVALEARALAQSVGKGNSAVAALLAPRQQKINWRKVIRHGFELACARSSRDWQTFAKRHRRSPMEGPQFPGWLGFDPRIAVLIDVSGSMDREWINQIVSEIKGLIKTFPGVSVYLVTHTGEVAWEGWVNQNTQAKIVDAVSFTGGTDPGPAYAAVKKVGRFDTLIHFTDCEFIGEWPPVPARQLVVGAFKREMACKPPVGAHIIPCEK
jgi:predicted metal-dependent peptidase